MDGAADLGRAVPGPVTLEGFLALFFEKMDLCGVRWAAMRGHQSLPARLDSRDLDILVAESDLNRAIRLIQEIETVSLIDFWRRPFCASLTIDGVGPRPIIIDLVCRLSWKGLAYADPEAVLARARPSAEWPPMRVIDPRDGAALTVLQTVMANGAVRDRYKESIRTELRGHQSLVTDLLLPAIAGTLRKAFGARLARGEIEAAEALIPAIKRSLLANRLTRNPLASIRAIAGHYLVELGLRLGGGDSTTIVLLGPDGSGKSTIGQGLSERLVRVVRSVDTLHLRPGLVTLRRRGTGEAVTDPHGRPPRADLIAIAKLPVWIADYWAYRLAGRTRNSCIVLYDRYFHDLLVDPRRYRYAAPRWVAAAFARLAPRVDGWILLDAPADVLQARKREVPPEESARQRAAYLLLVQGLPHGSVVDAGAPVSAILNQAETIVLGRMKARAAEKLATYLSRE